MTSTTRHCTREQADRLAKCAGFVAWAEARGLRVGDWVVLIGILALVLWCAPEIARLIGGPR